ncbi:MAG: hypothetical protein K1Y36_29110 [Blastocatellia bacterium]|nr:hypothetical protein [Blastocatellia bacterium]
MTKPNINQLLASLAQKEQEFAAATFVAPCLRQGRIQTRIAGLVRTLQPQPAHFEGWGLFRVISEKNAQLVEEAPLHLVEQYLKLFEPLRVLLVRRLRRQSWLAYPVNDSDAKQRFGTAQPILVHLVAEGDRFETALVRGAGQAWWFETLDRKADPVIAAQLRESLAAELFPNQLRVPGLTPEMRIAYDIALKQHLDSLKGKRGNRDEIRLRRALEVGGGQLAGYQDKEDHWLVEWTTSTGEQHTSAISKQDLSVMSSGICLSGRDHDFDLQSLVKVIEQRD